MEFIKHTPKENDICLSSKIRLRDNSGKKDYINKINDKPWGKEYLSFQNDNIGIWILYINKGCETSTHCHFKKDTILFPISGCFKINLFDSYKILHVLEKLYVPRNTFHGIHAYSDDAILIEIEIYTDKINYTDKNDLLRLRDKYKRDKTNYENSVLERTPLENEIINISNINEQFIINDTKICMTDNLEKAQLYDEAILLEGKLFNENIITIGSIVNLKKSVSLLTEHVKFLCFSNSKTKLINKIIYSSTHLNEYLKLKGHIFKNEIIGLTSGCFDLLHNGHINTLKFSKKQCDKFFVCLSSDEQIKRLKGENRPINNLNDRLYMLIHFDFIDNIILYDEENDKLETELDNIMNIIKPDIWFKGKDYNVNKIKEIHPILKEIRIIDSNCSVSTTKIISMISKKII
jgi:rfaE bifunctional protein nucleotidyltransferase chain/domain